MARWAVAHGDLLPAIDHACRSGDPDLVVDLVGRWGLALVLGGSGQALARLLRRTPLEVRSEPAVALVAAAGALDAEDVAAADDALAPVPPAAAPRADPALAATVALQRAHLLGTTAAELEVLEGTDAGASGRPELDLLATAGRGLARLKLGRLDAAEADLRRAAAGTAAAGYDQLALHCLAALAGVAASRDDAPEMGSRAAAALAFTAARGWERSPRCAFAHVIAGSAAYQRLDTPTARRHARAVVDLLDGTVEPSLRFAGLVLESALAFDAGEEPPARYRQVQRGWPAGDVGLPPVLVAHAGLEQQRMALALGEPAWTHEAVDRVEQRLGAGGELQYLRASLEAHRGRVPAARRLLADVCDGAVPAEAGRTVVEALVLDAVLADDSGDADAAHRRLTRALASAEGRQTVRYLTLAGRPVQELLIRDAGRFGRQEAFAAQVLRAFPRAPAAQGSRLTERERAILVELPSLRTAEEIAERQFVSVNTVKTHIRAIYRKLGVGSRRDALAAARARGLL
ncbi:helix-turn-helix domain-containing protein [Modestobacter sp. NPDC049651]|uniref:helix-turn-helix domain-containing protein n=1 Tax=unclassified Modestobacter TaxID=2643866 RepID=UPI0033CBFD6D